MTAQLLDGKTLAATIRRELAEQVVQRRQQGRQPPGLAAVLVGDNPASHVYVRNKHKACQEAGFMSWIHHLDASISLERLLARIADLNTDPNVHGILVQLPLPPHLDAEAVLAAVRPEKDVDGFHPINVGLLAIGRPRFYPCTPQGVMEILLRSGHNPAGREVVVVGRSNIVGKPLALMLMQKPSPQHPLGGDATVTVAHSRSGDLPAICRRADILIAAAGVPALITPEMVRPGAVVIDVGINKVEGRIVGDVHPAVAEVAAAVTPVPGGVGPMTIAMLLRNTLLAAQQLDVAAAERSP